MTAMVYEEAGPALPGVSVTAPVIFGYIVNNRTKIGESFVKSKQNLYFCSMSTEEQMKKDLYYMRRALAEAEAAYREGEIPVGAVVVCRDRIIARAHNLTETLNDVTAHAEMQAITMAASELGGKYLQDCTLYVTLEPCTMCAGAIGWAQLRRMVYGCPDEKRGYRLYAPRTLHPRAEVVCGVMEEECKALMQRFFRERR